MATDTRSELDRGGGVVRDVVISSGNRNFHLLFSAAEMARRNRLALLICGGYPTPLEQKLLKSPKIPGAAKLSRLLGRKEEIPDDLIKQNRLSEAISVAGISLRGVPRAKFADIALQKKAFEIYGRHAARHLPKAERVGARIYHYRAGFGQSSVKVAADAGMMTICDHSIVHPALLDVLVANGGRFPEVRPPRPDGIWGVIQDDLERADLVLVNSDFVAETFAFMGFDQSRIAVIYQGVEDKFLTRLPAQREYYTQASTRPVRFLFAGGIGSRKGVDEIAAVLSAVPDAKIELHVAGSLSASARQKYAGLLSDPRVIYHGILPQGELAKLMSCSDVFIFPSRAEGSARVVFEAMAAGCAVITTKNAGSALRDEEGGRIIAVSDVEALSMAIDNVLLDPCGFAELGQANATLIREHFTQRRYGDQLEIVYQRARSG
ncbi:glycosyltransferase family 4 protein [uncultured Martelella sp.]|uniref:glycosyltransferase family 4 protein n=1 Tax=uncultured Martelella sp. TaxID=392331 RepID=UPI0029C66C0F|nr:glycosyltransferase family 4 protein [uncultured Martelella sp.]